MNLVPVFIYRFIPQIFEIPSVPKFSLNLTDFKKRFLIRLYVYFFMYLWAKLLCLWTDSSCVKISAYSRSFLYNVNLNLDFNDTPRNSSKTIMKFIKIEVLLSLWWGRWLTLIKDVLILDYKGYFRNPSRRIEQIRWSIYWENYYNLWLVFT